MLTRFSINQLKRAQHDDELTARHELKGNDANKWHEANDKQIKALEKIKC